MNLWFRVYGRMPIWAQNATCSLTGIKMRRTRYNKTFHMALRFLEESQWWSLEELRSYQNEQLQRITKHAYDTVPELERMREVFRRTSKLADELGIEEVTPWVALASGLRRHTIKMQKWSSDWDYDLIYSWCLGAELNHPWYAQRPKRYAPYNRAKVVVFFPAPFSTKAIHWPKHFIAYIRGATGIRDLADLGYIE